MTPAELAQLALEAAGKRSERRQARLFHPAAYAEADAEFLAAVTGAAEQLASPAGEDETPRKAAPGRRR